MPVIVWKSEEQRDVCTGADLCISIDFFWSGKILKRLLKLGVCHGCFKIDIVLMLESRVSTSHYSRLHR